MLACSMAMLWYMCPYRICHSFCITCTFSMSIPKWFDGLIILMNPLFSCYFPKIEWNVHFQARENATMNQVATQPNITMEKPGRYIELIPHCTLACFEVLWWAVEMWSTSLHITASSLRTYLYLLMWYSALTCCILLQPADITSKDSEPDISS